jgi:rhamnulokinase
MSEGQRVFLAVDLGASSGRVVAGLFDGVRLSLEEIHRFQNGGVLFGDRLHWDIVRLWREITEGLRKAAIRFGDSVVSVGVDTWGVDFALFAGDRLLENPIHYRDHRTDGIYESAFSILPKETIFAETGLQFMPFNSLFQLHALRLENSPVLQHATRLLMIPDVFHWLLSGQMVNEYTNATTTQLLDPRARQWSAKLIEAFDLPSQLFTHIGQPGEVIGGLRKSVAEATGLSSVQVVLPGTHDTASAVMAVPASGEPTDRPNWCYISSGTWSLMGAEVKNPIINDDCFHHNFTNEGGVGGTTRLLKNIAGLWLIQECRRIWSLRGEDWEWADFVQMADSAEVCKYFFNPDHLRFTAPDDMPAEICAACAEAGQGTPQTEAEIVRAAFDSLALRYRMVFDWTEQLTGGPIDTIHIVGGGVQNQLLCQITADACQRRVLAGPVEATGIGNIMMQAVAHGDVQSIAAAREIVSNSFEVREYTPRNSSVWNDSLVRFREIDS